MDLPTKSRFSLHITGRKLETALRKNVGDTKLTWRTTSRCLCKESNGLFSYKEDRPFSVTFSKAGDASLRQEIDDALNSFPVAFNEKG